MSFDFSDAINYADNGFVRIMKYINAKKLNPIETREPNHKDYSDGGLYTDIWFHLPNGMESNDRIKVKFYEPRKYENPNRDAKSTSYIGSDGSEILQIGRITLAFNGGSFGGVSYFICESKPDESEFRVVYQEGDCLRRTNTSENNQVEHVIGTWSIDKSKRECLYGSFEQTLRKAIIQCVKKWDLICFDEEDIC